MTTQYQRGYAAAVEEMTVDPEGFVNKEYHKGFDDGYARGYAAGRLGGYNDAAERAFRLLLEDL